MICCGNENIIKHTFSHNVYLINNYVHYFTKRIHEVFHGFFETQTHIYSLTTQGNSNKMTWLGHDCKSM